MSTIAITKHCFISFTFFNWLDIELIGIVGAKVRAFCHTAKLLILQALCKEFAKSLHTV
jgi:hypothetical protein